MIKKVVSCLFALVSLQASAVTLSPMTLEKASKNNTVLHLSLGDKVCVSTMWAQELTLGENAVSASNEHLCADIAQAGPNIIEVTDLYGKSILVDSIAK